ncbi:mitochondrial outer membrane protein SLC25A46-like [Convolutriloba macropyga]|uniref:mitochondrial outer membrane protein SLC25A46-like n=1 Tax=Convolutriloba macropyga TaxID=536237 RepID=UPI003F5265C3
MDGDVIKYESTDDEDYDDEGDEVDGAYTNTTHINTGPVSINNKGDSKAFPFTNKFHAFFGKSKKTGGGSRSSSSEVVQSKFQFNDAASNREERSIEKIFPPQIIDAASVFVDHIVCHPFSMLKMLCQVNYSARCTHVTPFTVIPLVYSQISLQGFGAMWKGLKSSLIFHGLSRVCETTVSGMTNYPLEARSVYSFKRFFQHLSLKSASFVLMTPFYASFVFETVQSYSATDFVGILEGIGEGFKRVFEVRSPSIHRAVPIWKLIVPMALCHLGHYLVYKFVKGALLIYIRHRVEAEKCFNRDKQLPVPYKPEMELMYPQILSTILAKFIASSVIYPAQTALHRLCIQGTRCIIDSSDIVGEVLPINTQYRGFTHCMTSIIRDEGHVGLFRGFGVLVMQCAFQLGAFYFLQPTFEKALELSKQMN